LPALRNSALNPKVSILAKQTSGSRGRNVKGQYNSGFLYFDQVSRLDPPRPCMKTISALWPFSGTYMTFRPSGPESVSPFFREWSLLFREFNPGDVLICDIERWDVVDPTWSSETGTERPGGLDLGLRDCDAIRRNRGWRPSSLLFRLKLNDFPNYSSRIII
jgi:hypothetical protein